MTDVYVIRNQLGHYWAKSKEWADGTDPHVVLRTPHEDEAINTLFELSSKDFELRGEVVKVALSERKEPVIEPSEHLLPKAGDDAGDEVAPADAASAEQSGQEPKAGTSASPA